MHTYKKRYINESGDYEIIQVRDNDDDRVISEFHYDYVAYIQSGNEPEIIEYVPDPVPSLEDAKSNKREEIKNKRREQENSGTLWKGYNIGTTQKDQTNIMLASLSAQSNSDYVINWKFDDVFIEITSVDIIEIRDLIRTHIQEAFDKEALINISIDSAKTISEVEMISWA